LTPESTLTPAPVNTAARPDERKEAMRWTASEGDTVGTLRLAAVERIEGGMFGTERRMGSTRERGWIRPPGAEHALGTTRGETVYLSAYSIVPRSPPRAKEAAVYVQLILTLYTFSG
jgi:hypothetical protein